MKLSLPISWHKRWHNPFRYLRCLSGTIYREQPGRRTLQFYEDQRAYFLKYHWGVGWREIIKNLWQGKRPILGARSEVMAIKKLSFGGFVPKIAGYGWRGINPAKQESFIITVALMHHINLAEFCRDWLISPPLLTIKRALIRQVATIVRQIHAQGVNHQDLYLCHFLLNQKTVNDANITVIDWHRAQIWRQLPLYWRIKDLSALYFSAMDLGLTKSDYYRFIKIYDPRFCWSAVAKRAGKIYRKVWRKLIPPQGLPCCLQTEKGEKLAITTSLSVTKYIWIVTGQWRGQIVTIKLYRYYHQAIQAVTPDVIFQDWLRHRALYLLIYKI